MPKVVMTFDGDMEGARIVNLGAGRKATDGVNKGQLDQKLDAAEKGQMGGIATLDEAGKVPSSQLPAALNPSIILSGTDHGVWIDLNSVSEQRLRIPHGRRMAPGEREVFFEPVADAALDLGAVCIEYVKYLAKRSTAAELVFAIKLRTGTGTPGQQGQLRVLIFAG